MGQQRSAEADQPAGAARGRPTLTALASAGGRAGGVGKMVATFFVGLQARVPGAPAPRNRPARRASVGPKRRISVMTLIMAQACGFVSPSSSKTRVRPTQHELLT